MEENEETKDIINLIRSLYAINFEYNNDDMLNIGEIQTKNISITFETNDNRKCSATAKFSTIISNNDNTCIEIVLPEYVRGFRDFLNENNFNMKNNDKIPEPKEENLRYMEVFSIFYKIIMINRFNDVNINKSFRTKFKFIRNHLTRERVIFGQGRFLLNFEEDHKDECIVNAELIINIS